MGHHAALRVAHQFNNIDKSIVFCCVSEPSTARGSFFGHPGDFRGGQEASKNLCMSCYLWHGGHAGGGGAAGSAGRQGRRGGRVGRVGGAAGSGGY